MMKMMYLFCVFGIVFSQMNSNLTQLGLVDAVGRGGDVPVVEEDAAALIARDPDVDLPRQLGKLCPFSADDPGAELILVRNATIGLIINRLLVINVSRDSTSGFHQICVLKTEKIV